MSVLRTYTVVLERNEDGGYTVTVPALKGCVTQGQTISEALTRIQEAMTCHIESLVSLGMPVASIGAKWMEVAKRCLQEVRSGEVFAKVRKRLAK